MSGQAAQTVDDPMAEKYSLDPQYKTLNQSV